MYLFVKAFHIIFIVTWFAGMFYIVRLFIYNREAQDKPEAEREVLQAQFQIMMRRLWFGITWPSAMVTLFFGAAMGMMYSSSAGLVPDWLAVKFLFVIGLYAYHYSLHVIYTQQMRGDFRYTSKQLRWWNEMASIFLIVIVLLAVMKEALIG